MVIFLSDYLLARETLLYAHDEEMTEGDYAFIMLQMDQEQYVTNKKNPAQLYLSIFSRPPDRQCDYYQALESVIVVELMSSTSAVDAAEAWLNQISMLSNDPPFYTNTVSLSHFASLPIMKTVGHNNDNNKEKLLYIFIYIYKLLEKKTTNKLQVHPDKPVS